MAIMTMSPNLLTEEASKEETLEVLRAFLQGLVDTGDTRAIEPLEALNRGDIAVSMPLLVADHEDAYRLAFGYAFVTGMESSQEEIEEEREEWEEKHWKPYDQLIGALWKHFPETKT